MGSNEQQYGHFISFAKIRLGFNENGRLGRDKCEGRTDLVKRRVADV